MDEKSKIIDKYILSLPGWQADNLDIFRKLLHNVEPSLQEDWKWSVPVFILNGKTVFAMSAFKNHTKYNFILNGAQLVDENKLFNNGLESKRSRGIDLRENEKIDTALLRTLITESLDLLKIQ